MNCALLAVALGQQLLNREKDHPGQESGRKQGQISGEDLGNPGRKEKAGAKDAFPLVRLARPDAAKVVVPRAFVGPVDPVKREHQTGPAVRRHPTREQVFVFPVTDLDVDIWAVLFARRAALALRVVGLDATTHSCRLKVGFFDDGNWTEEVAPGLARKDRTDDKCAQSDS